MSYHKNEENKNPKAKSILKNPKAKSILENPKKKSILSNPKKDTNTNNESEYSWAALSRIFD
jgi:hypothetical protein